MQHVLADGLFLKAGRARVGVQMEVCRAPPTVSEEDLSQQSVQAVAALHKSMVTLRTELVKKNQRIRELEEKETKGGNEKQAEQRPFEDMFVLQVLKEDVDQILKYEDSLARAKQQEQEQQERDALKKRRQYEAVKDKVEEDPVEAFVALSDDDDDEDKSSDAVDGEKKGSCNSFRLVPNKDILIHPRPTSLLSNNTAKRLSLSEPTMERPILRSPKWPRAAAASQTEISAAFGWKSEPQLADNSNRNANVSVKVERRPVVLSSGAKREIEKRSGLLNGKAGGLRTTSNPVKKKVLVDPPSSDLDDILQEADRYLEVAKQRLVTCQDWADIRRKKKS